MTTGKVLDKKAHVGNPQMRGLCFGVLLVLALPYQSSAALLARNGNTEYSIVVAKDASPSDTFAAKELPTSLRRGLTLWLDANTNVVWSEEKGGIVIVDSRHRIGLYEDVIVKPNEIEAFRVFKGKIKATDFEKLAKALEVRTGHPAIVTAGEKGCYVSENGRVVHVPACKVTGEIDFCGAGDTFLSAVACATAAGFDLVEAAHLACCASAVTIKKLKTTGTANRHELSYSLCEIQVRHEAKPDARARYGAGCSFRSPSVCENIKARHSVACARSVNVQTKGARRDGYVVSNKKIV